MLPSISQFLFANENLSLFQARGSVAGNTGVNDTVVNQLLSKIDGVNQVCEILEQSNSNKLLLVQINLFKIYIVEQHPHNRNDQSSGHD